MTDNLHEPLEPAMGDTTNLGDSFCRGYRKHGALDLGGARVGHRRRDPRTDVHSEDGRCARLGYDLGALRRLEGGIRGAPWKSVESPGRTT
jgi:hypothetical protein